MDTIRMVELHQNPQVVRYFIDFARIASFTLILLALATVAGLVYEIPLLAGIFPNKYAIRGSTAVGFILIGLALLSSLNQNQYAKRISLSLSSLVLTLAITNIMQFVLSINLGMNNWFIRSTLDNHQTLARRMPLETAIAISMLGIIGILTVLKRILWLRETCAVLVLAIAMLTLGNYGFSLDRSLETLFSTVAFNSAVLLLIATLGWLSSTPSVGLTKISTADSIGGAFARRLLLPSMLLPIAFTFLLRLMQTTFGLSESLAVSMTTLFTGSSVAFLVWWVANLLHKAELQRRQSLVLSANANTDALTNIANRRAFDDKLIQMLRGRREHDNVFSLLMLDLDNFKYYNDTFGHLAGDDVLRHTGQLLSTALRPSDFAARYGGEEFALLLARTDSTQARIIAERIIADFHTFNWPYKPITTSIGIAEARLDDTPEVLIQRADAALYQAKHEGRDRAV